MDTVRRAKFIRLDNKYIILDIDGENKFFRLAKRIQKVSIIEFINKHFRRDDYITVRIVGERETDKNGNTIIQLTVKEIIGLC